MTLERPHLPACASLHADRLLRWCMGAENRQVSIAQGEREKTIIEKTN